MCYREIFKDIIFVDMQYLLFLSPAAYQAGLKADVGVHTVRPGLKVFWLMLSGCSSQSQWQLVTTGSYLPDSLVT